MYETPACRVFNYMVIYNLVSFYLVIIEGYYFIILGDEKAEHNVATTVLGYVWDRVLLHLRQGRISMLEFR
jgi:hypothetical protein